MLRFKLSVCLAAMLLAAGAYAQQNKGTGLKYLLDQVAQNAPALVSDSSAILIKAAQARETANNWLPNLKVSYQANLGTNNNVGGPYFGFGMVPTNNRGVRDESNTTAVLSNLGIAAFDWEVYNFGGYSAQNKAAQGEVDVQRNQFATSKYNLQAYTIDSYLQLLQLVQYQTVQQRNIRRNQEIQRSIRALARSGIRAGVDTSIAAAELSKSRLNYIELTNQAKQIQIRLAAISGLPSQSIVPDTASEYRFIQQAIGLEIAGADTIGHPVIKLYQSMYENSLQRQEAAKKSFNPKLMLSAAAWGRAASVDADQNFQPLHNGWGFQRNNYLVGLGVVFNLTDLKRRQVRLRTQKAAATFALNKLNEQKNMLLASTAQADANLSTAAERLREIPQQLKAANAAYRQKLSLYKSGLTNIIELNAALSLLYRAEMDHIAARYSYAQALFQKAIADNKVNTVINLLN